MTIKAEATKLYRLLKGTHVVSSAEGAFRHVFDGTKGKDEQPAIALTDAQYAQFKDKFEPITDKDEVADQGEKITGTGPAAPAPLPAPAAPTAPAAK